MIVPVPQPPEGREAALGAVMKASLRGAAPRRRSSTMRSRTAPNRVKEPIYPMFLDLANQCQEIDDYWYSFFTSVAYGRLPQGVILQEDCLIFKTRKKRTPFQLTEETKKDWRLVADFFRHTCNRFSELDWQTMKDDAEKPDETKLTKGKINKLVRRQLANAIPEFAMVLKKRHHLTRSEMSEVDTLLKYYANANLFRPGDVVHSIRGTIEEIKTLVFDEETRKFSITAEAKGPRYTVKESYQNLITYLKAPPFTRPTERRTTFDEEIKVHLNRLYAPIVGKKKKTPIKKKVVPVAE